MLAWLIQFLLQWYIWLPIVAILTFLTWRNYKKAAILNNYEYVVLALDLPDKIENSEVSAEQMFVGLHGILRDKRELKLSGGFQEYLSFEMTGRDGQVRFFVRTPKHLQNFVEGQILAQYPSIGIRQVQDYATNSNFSKKAVTELALSDSDVIPIKTYCESDIDLLTSTIAALTKNINGETWVQILLKPVADAWHSDSERFVRKVKAGTGTRKIIDLTWYVEALMALWRPPTHTSRTETIELSDKEKVRISGAEKKCKKTGFMVKIRIASLGANQETVRSQIHAVIKSFKQFHAPSINSFKLTGKPSANVEELKKYPARYFDGRGFILNTEELATIWHLPNHNVQKSESEKSVIADEISSDLPLLSGDRAHDDQISAFGLTKVSGMDRQFGLHRNDRSRHVYIIGQTGTGKTALLEMLTLSDIYHNQGYAIIDPHGDFALNNLKFIPPNRIEDVVYFNPSDTDFPIGFNPMEIYDPTQRNNISSEIIGVLKRMFGNSWGPRLEYILRYTILALLEYPNATMLDITRMLTDKKFRDKVLRKVTDVMVLQFWKVEFGSWGERETNLAVAPILNKVGAFVANPIIRNIIGQPKSTFNMREIMDQGKILIINLSKGLIGEDNSAILGALLITKIQLAAMSRSDISSIEDRPPFYLYVDEFQNFATDSFAVILSEARKYGLNLTVANQYISQMSETVRKAVFGNVGTVISMRASSEDSPALASQFAPYFNENDILQMNNRQFIASLIVDGKKIPAVSGVTLKLPPVQTDYIAQIVRSTRVNFSRPRAEVEQMIAKSMSMDLQIQPASTSRTQQKSPTIVGSQALTDNISIHSENQKVKRHRTRGRRRKSSEVSVSDLPPPPTFTNIKQ